MCSASSVAIFVTFSAQSQLARQCRARAFRALVSRFSSTRSKTRSDAIDFFMKYQGLWVRYSKFYSKQISNDTSLLTNQKSTSFPGSLSLLSTFQITNSKWKILRVKLKCIYKGISLINTEWKFYCLLKGRSKFSTTWFISSDAITLKS